MFFYYIYIDKQFGTPQCNIDNYRFYDTIILVLTKYVTHELIIKEVI